MEYTKTAKSITDLIEMLHERGLTISDVGKAQDFFQKVSYFRIAAYFRPLEQDKETHIYKPGSTFESAVALYEFDSALRMLAFSCIQTIEIALRSRMIQVFPALRCSILYGLLA